MKNFQFSIFNFQRGQSLVEIILVMGLSAIILPALLTGLVSSRQGKAQQAQRTQAVYLLNETVDAVRSVRERGWESFAVDGIYHVATNSDSWILATGTAVANGFSQQIIIGDVNRDSSGAITSSGGTLDPSSKKVDISISWDQPYLSTVNASLYMTRYLDNNSFTQTSVSDFTGVSGNMSNLQGSVIVNDNGGEVVLGAGGNSDWCKPNLSLTPLDLPGQGIMTAVSATTSANMDYVYTTTGGNASGDSMDAVSITHANPPVAGNAGTYNNYKTYGLFVDNQNQYVYLTSDHPGLTVDIIGVGIKPYTQTGTFTASEGSAGSSVTVAYSSFLNHDVGYVTAGNVFYSFDLANRNGPRPQLGFASLAGTGKKIIVVGNYAYVAVASSGEQLNIYDVSDPSKPKKVSHIDVHNGQPATDLFVNSTGTRVYLVTKQASQNTNDFFIIDTTNKIDTLPDPIGSFNTGTMSPTGVVLVPGGRAIIVGSGGEQYQVLKVSTETAPSHCGGLTNPNGATAINAIAAIIRDDGDAYSYILTNNSGAEFQMIAGGPGGSVSASGTFESSIFDSGYMTSFNRFDATINQPDQTSIQMQVAVAPFVNNSCANSIFNYVGPNGIGGASPSAYFTTNTDTISGAIPFGTYNNYGNPNRCFRYKVYFSTLDTTQTPIFYDITINYSP